MRLANLFFAFLLFGVTNARSNITELCWLFEYRGQNCPLCVSLCQFSFCHITCPIVGTFCGNTNKQQHTLSITKEGFSPTIVIPIADTVSNPNRDANDNTNDRGDCIKNLLDGFVVSNHLHQFIILFGDGVVEKNGGVHCSKELVGGLSILFSTTHQP